MADPVSASHSAKANGDFASAKDRNASFFTALQSKTRCEWYLCLTTLRQERLCFAELHSANELYDFVKIKQFGSLSRVLVIGVAEWAIQNGQSRSRAPFDGCNLEPLENWIFV